MRKFVWKNKIAITACTLTIAFSIGFWVLSQVPTETSVGDDLIVAGNVGIGTTTPALKLDVVGGVRIIGNNDNWKILEVDQIGLGPIVEFKQSGNIKFTVDNAGKVGIGTTTPTHKLDVRGQIRQVMNTDWDVWIQGGPVNNGDDRNLAILGADEDSGDRLYINYNAEYASGTWLGGAITGTYGNYHVASDERLKKDIVTITNALDKVLALRGVNFKWRDNDFDNGTLQMGLIAQEVETVIPEVVHTVDDEMETKAIEYQYMIGLLVEAIKEQQKEIDDLKTKINAGQ